MVSMGVAGEPTGCATLVDSDFGVDVAAGVVTGVFVEESPLLLVAIGVGLLVTTTGSAGLLP